MALLWEPEFWARLFGIGVLNLLLSGDNALVIALAVRALPPRQRVLGQVWGALGAVALRVMFVAIVTLLLRVPLLARLMNRWAWIVWLGGGFLAYVAVEMVFEDKAVVGWLGAMGMQIKMPVSVGAGAVVAALGWWLARRPHAAVPEDI